MLLQVRIGAIWNLGAPPCIYIYIDTGLLLIYYSNPQFTWIDLSHSYMALRAGFEPTAVTF